MAVAWLLFPLVMLAVTLGCGLLAEQASGRRLPLALVVPLGLAVVIVVAELATNWHATAGLTTPAVLVLALAGYALGYGRLRAAVVDRWAIGVGVAVFAVYAAPVVLSGHATFLGYFFLNDTAWHLVLIDQLLHRGRDVSGLPASSYEAVARGYLNTKYPVGSQLGAGALRPLVGQDAAWVFQPYIAVMLATAGVVMHRLLHGVVQGRALRAVIAFVAIQPGLVYAYYLQASIKELATLWVLLLLVGLVVEALRVARPGVRALVPAAIASAAALDILNLAVLPWIGVPLGVLAAGVLWQWGPRRVVGWAVPLAVLAGLAAVLAVPALQGAREFVNVAQQVLTTHGDLGNLVHPLSWWQIVGIWPSGDFRLAPQVHERIEFALIGVAIAGAVLGVLWMLRRRAAAPLLFVVSSLIAVLYLRRDASPYALAKTMMIGSPAALLCAMLGAAALRDLGRRVEAWLLAGAIAAGVLWTNGLAYHDANLAPRSRLAELSAIGDRFGGPGKAFLDERDELAGYFLRKVNAANDPVIAPQRRSDLPPRDYRRAFITLDLDELDTQWLEQFRLIVQRRSPLASRPPANYDLVWQRRYYSVWQRRSRPQVLEHQPQGGLGAAVAPAPCAVVARLAARARSEGGRLAFSAPPSLVVFNPTGSARPAQWGLVEQDPLEIRINGPAGTARGTVTVPRPGRYRLWIQGNFDRDLTVRIDGRKVGTIGHALGPQGQFFDLGTKRLAAGTRVITIHRPGSGLSPGDGGTTRLLGLTVLQPAGIDSSVTYLPPAAFRQLCGRRLDWIEIVR